MSKITFEEKVKVTATFTYKGGSFGKHLNFCLKEKCDCERLEKCTPELLIKKSTSLLSTAKSTIDFLKFRKQ